MIPNRMVLDLKCIRSKFLAVDSHSWFRWEVDDQFAAWMHEWSPSRTCSAILLVNLSPLVRRCGNALPVQLRSVILASSAWWLLWWSKESVDAKKILRWSKKMESCRIQWKRKFRRHQTWHAERGLDQSCWWVCDRDEIDEDCCFVEWNPSFRVLRRFCTSCDFYC